MAGVSRAGFAARRTRARPIASFAAGTLAHLRDIAPMVDVLATALDEPSVLCELFVQADEHVAGGLLEELWRHDQPETIEILDTLGRHLPDKKMAKACRKAAIRHRSWTANKARAEEQ